MKKKTPAPVRPSRVVAYIRVSSEKQVNEGYSLEAQKAKLESYAKTFELEIVAFEVDAGMSGSSLERPGLQSALARLDAFEAEGLLVVKLDRLTRSVRDLDQLIETYFKDGQNSLISLSEQIDTRSATGRMVIGILMQVFQWEREAIGERTAAVMQHMRESGKYTGGWPPYGFREADGMLIAAPAEQACITRAKELRERGHSLRAIACALGNNPRTGGAFSASQVGGMI